MRPTTGNNFKQNLKKLRVTCPGWFNMELLNEAFFPFSNRCYDYCKIFTHCHSSSCQGDIFFHQIKQPISPNHHWENGIKQIKITEKKLAQSCILCQLLRAKTLVSGSKCIKHFFEFYHYLPYICWVEVIYLIFLVFLKSPWWLVWIFFVPTPLI